MNFNNSTRLDLRKTELDQGFFSKRHKWRHKQKNQQREEIKNEEALFLSQNGQLIIVRFKPILRMDSRSTELGKWISCNEVGKPGFYWTQIKYEAQVINKYHFNPI